MIDWTLFQIIAELMVLNIAYLTVLMNGVGYLIILENSIATFKRNVLSLIKDNCNIYFYICTCVYFS